MNIKIDQTMSEFQLAQALKKIVKEVLGVRDVKNTSRNAIAKINEVLGEKLNVEMNKNKSLTNLIKDTKKLVKNNTPQPVKLTVVSVNGSTVFPLDLSISPDSEEQLLIEVAFNHEHELSMSDLRSNPHNAIGLRDDNGKIRVWQSFSEEGDVAEVYCIDTLIARVHIGSL